VTTTAIRPAWAVHSLTATLVAGQNTVELRDSEGALEPDVDYLEVNTASNLTRFEAEYSFFSNAAAGTDAPTMSGASSGQFVDNSAGSVNAWTLNSPGGTQVLRFNTTSYSGARSLGVFVNGTRVGAVTTTTLRPTWAVQSVTTNLALGSNTIELRDSEGTSEPDVDYFEANANSNMTRLQAESATYVNSVPGNDPPAMASASGGQYVDGNAGAVVSFTVNSPGGNQALKFATTSPSGARSFGVFVNGTRVGAVTTTTIRPTWAVQTLNVNLPVGNTTIELRDSEGTAEPDVDYFETNTAGININPCSGTSGSVIVGKDWCVNGQRWIAKGVNWNPVEMCEGNGQQNWSRAISVNGNTTQGDAALMQAGNFNTVRTYTFKSNKTGLENSGYLSTAQLDAFNSRGIKVLVGVHNAPGDSTWNVNWQQTCAGDATFRPAPGGGFTTEAQAQLQALNAHPAVLGFVVGNEIRYNYFYTKGAGYDNCWTVDMVVTHANHVTSQLKTVVGITKPVVTSWGNTWDITTKMPSLTADVISYQIYNYLELDNIFNLHPQNSNKPFLMTEFGADHYNATTGQQDYAMQATANTNLFTQILNNSKTGAGGVATHKIVGGTVFAWNDEWWKAGALCSQENGGAAPGTGPYSDGTFNEENWGICSVNAPRTCYQSYTELTSLFAQY
jgi:hypothetical protein